MATKNDSGGLLTEEERGADRVRHDLASAYDWITTPGGLGGESKKAPAKAKGKAKAKADPKPSGPTAAEIEKEIAANPFAQMGQGLVKGLEAQEAPVQQAVSGQLTAPAVNSALSEAFAASGLSPTSAAGQLVGANIAQGEKNAQPLQEAMSAYGTAFGQGQSTIDNALTNLGQANALGVATAPEQQWLTSLQSHIQENLAYSGNVPTAAIANLPPALQYYLQQSGNSGVGGAGVIPISSIAIPKADQQYEPQTPKIAATKNPLSTMGAAPGVAPGTVPASGNPSTPGA